MAVFIACLVLFLAMTGHSNADYCVCNSQFGDSALQKNIDYACGAGADCSAILQNGPCFNPNTLRDHCNYAVNSYYQRKSQAPGSCSFSGTASVSQTVPSATSGCVYPSSASNAGSSTSTNQSTSPPGTTLPGSTMTPGFGQGPTGSSITNPDNSNGATGSMTAIRRGCNLLVFSSVTLFFSGLI